MPPIRLIALDLDGTSLQKSTAAFSPRLAAALERAVTAGIEMLPATGRALSILPDCVKALPGIRYALTSNGAAVWHLDGPNCLFLSCMTLSAVREAIAVLERFPLHYELYCGGDLFAPQEQLDALAASSLPLDDNHIIRIRQRTTGIADISRFVTDRQTGFEKINLPVVPAAQYAPLLDAFAATGLFTVLGAADGNVEITARNVNKGAALSRLCARLGIDPGDVLAIGDSSNDIEMLRFAGHGAAMGNAPESVRRAARHIAPSLDQDGAAFLIEQFLP